MLRNGVAVFQVELLEMRQGLQGCETSVCEPLAVTEVERGKRHHPLAKHACGSVVDAITTSQGQGAQRRELPKRRKASVRELVATAHVEIAKAPERA